MAPERLAPDLPVFKDYPKGPTAQSDVYSFAMVIIEAWDTFIVNGVRTHERL
jgi:hypothetical protein